LKEVWSVESYGEMASSSRLPELLVPAGDAERLHVAVHYGADAVYAGLQELNLRAGANNFNREQFMESVDFAHRHGVRVYAVVNVMAHNHHLNQAEALLAFLNESGVDGLIISDPGVAEMAKKITPGIPLHLSTQANVTNWKSAYFWFQQGFKRVNLARELTLEEIKEIREKIPGLELESFVHGAMCLAYSGRCVLSSYFTGRGANRGACTHPCRWQYHLVEDYRPGEPLPVIEDEEGTYILSSRDLCMLEYLPDLWRAGLDSLKIEGRMKTIHYVASVTKIYREALDSLERDPTEYRIFPRWKEELEKVSHRPYSTGFYFGSPLQVEPSSEKNYFKKCILAGVVLDYFSEQDCALVEQRNRFGVGDRLEVLTPGSEPFKIEVNRLYTVEGEEIEKAPHPQQRLILPVNVPLKKWDLLRIYID